MGSGLVLDAWPVMVWLKNQQPAANIVLEWLQRAERGEIGLLMNVINLGEGYYLTVKARGPDFGERVLRNLYARVRIIPARNELVMEAAKLKAQFAISYADAFAAVTAMQHNTALLTGNEELRTVALEHTKLQLKWIGSGSG